MQKPITPQIPTLRETESRKGVREAVSRLYDWIHSFVSDWDQFTSDVAKELNPLYGEFDYTPALLANGAQTTVTVTVTNAILGYTVEASYSQDLQNLQMTAHVSGTDTVKIVLKNDTGAGVTLAAGRFRCYVWPRILSS